MTDALDAPVRVALVDDQPLVRAGLRMVIDSQPDLRVVVEADDGRDALRLLASTASDVVLMDVRMPGMDGLTATRALLGDGGVAAGDPRVVVLTTFDLDEYVLDAIRAGATTALSTLGDVPLVVPWPDVVAVLGVALVAGLVASVVPARAAVRTRPVAALAAD